MTDDEQKMLLAALAALRAADEGSEAASELARSGENLT
jgi:hypothetical protein